MRDTLILQSSDSDAPYKVQDEKGFDEAVVVLTRSIVDCTVTSDRTISISIL